MNKSLSLTLLILVYSLLFLSLFHADIFHDVAFFYRGIFYISVASILLYISLVRIKTYASLQSSSIAAIVIAFFCTHVVFFTLVPVTLDRSVSIFLLQYMNANGAASTKKQMEEVLIDGFILKGDAVGKRMIEQEQTGSIRPDAGGWRITPRGVWLVNAYRVIGALFGLQPQSK